MDKDVYKHKAGAETLHILSHIRVLSTMTVTLQTDLFVAEY
jgi:hypothetical protein